MTTPSFLCRCCGEPLQVREQGCKPQRIDGKIVFTQTMRQLECLNTTCAFWMQTFTDSEEHPYSERDLSAYMKG